ncbi:hypothetical protein R82526_03314 [Ralstonia mannitolilytica]|uniref:hypothetical protein n=1 Tax=Ralstonia mannitolilytica TaxID=105219 RepID=UPI000B09D7A5|nr:hypothetical protein [Ralstonia mannitolilytica]CAJ0689411.1 hypothetical protein R82526_03314 [Ralstonia mannitolilytica]CAJ0737171.1 hypothetical protein R76696_01446 [Ralstonia mannitolilytica]CAJ0796421.1 hypothetical protein LMG18090_03419 [Ralstonia mannitolilytica]CAJ0870633.1 hypothetical protein R76727_02391 [Ralstonia mannitolilytica]
MSISSPRVLAARERRAVTHATRHGARRDTHALWQPQRLQQRQCFIRRCTGGQQHVAA